MSGVAEVLILLTALLAAVVASPPVFVWTSRNLHIDAPSLGETLDNDDFKDRVTDKIFKALPGTNVALFVQPRLSFPDLLSYGSDAGLLTNLRRFVTPAYHAVTLDRVLDPLASFRSSVDDDRVSVVDVASAEQVDEKLQHSNPHLVNVFKISLPDVGADNSIESMRSNDALIGKIMKKFQGVNHPFVGVFTGEASDEQPSVHSIKKRETPSGADDLNNLWDSSCIKAYFKAITVSIFNGNNLVDTFELKTKPTVTSACDAQPNSITADYKEANGNTVKITLEVKPYGKGSWQLSSVMVGSEGKDSKGTAWKTNDTLQSTVKAWASKGFSFHCSDPKIHKTDERDGKDHARLELKEMQIQGMMKTASGKTSPFGDAFDCVGFFSVPILMGLMTTLLLVFFTTFAVVAMASIKTPEKFDDPKGPTISVPHE